MDVREEGKANMTVNDKDTTLDRSDGLRKAASLSISKLLSY